MGNPWDNDPVFTPPTDTSKAGYKTAPDTEPVLPPGAALPPITMEQEQRRQAGPPPPPGEHGRMQPVYDAARVASDFMFPGLNTRAQAGLDVLMRGDSYETALANQRARNEAASKRLGPLATGTAQAVGGLTGGAGIAGTGATLLGRAGTGLMRNAAAGAAEAGLYGAAQGAGHNYSGDPASVAGSAATGAWHAAPFGAAVPFVGPVARGLYHGIAGIGSEVPGYVGTAVRADLPGVRGIANRPDALLPDAGPSMLGLAQGAYTGAGPGHTALDTVLRQRDAATGARLNAGVDQIYGPATVPSQRQAQITGQMRAMGPEYEQTMLNARAVNTEPIANWLDAQIVNRRGPARAAVREVRNMLELEGSPGVLDPHPGVLHEVRGAVRGMRDDATDPRVQRVLGDVYRQITAELNTRVPGYSHLSSRYAEQAAQRDALGLDSIGARMFRGGNQVVRPQELAQGMQEAARPKGTAGPSAEPLRQREAARDQLAIIMGTKGNTLPTLREKINQPWTREKMSEMWSPEQTIALNELVNENAGFRNTYQNVVQNSQTAQRQAAKEGLEAARGKIPLEANIAGMAARGVQSTVDMFRREAAENTRDAIARMLAEQDKVAQQNIANRWLAGTEGRERNAARLRALVERGLVSGAPAVVSQP